MALETTTRHRLRRGDTCRIDPGDEARLKGGLVGGAMVMVCWWCWGRVFRNVGLVVK